MKRKPNERMIASLIEKRLGMTFPQVAKVLARHSQISEQRRRDIFFDIASKIASKPRIDTRLVGQLGGEAQWNIALNELRFCAELVDALVELHTDKTKPAFWIMRYHGGGSGTVNRSRVSVERYFEETSYSSADVARMAEKVFSGAPKKDAILKAAQRAGMPMK